MDVIVIVISFLLFCIGCIALVAESQQAEWAQKWTGKMFAWTILPFVIVFLYLMIFDPYGTSGGGDEWTCIREGECYRDKDISNMIP